MNGQVYRLKKDAEVTKGLSLKAGQELEIVMNVVYMGGFPIPPDMQTLFLNFIKNNKELFVDDTRTW
jgi:hypothetical protein